MKTEILNEYAQNILKIVRYFKTQLDRALAPYDITGQQARVLELIYLFSKDGSSVYQKDIEREMGLRASSVTSLIQGLERRAFITRKSGKDARYKQLALTEKGASLHAAIVSAFQQSEDKIVRGMNEEEREAFLSFLKNAIKNFEQEGSVRGRDE